MILGYLKASVAVLGPGNVCPDLSARKSDEDDIEANLSWSAGVHLQQATFILSIYCAQNLPRSKLILLVLQIADLQPY